MIKGYVEDKSDWESQNRSCCKNSWFFLQNVPFASDGVILQFRYITDDLSAEEEGGGTAFVKGELVSIAFETGEKSHVIDFGHNGGSIDTQYPTERDDYTRLEMPWGWKIKNTALTQNQYGIWHRYWAKVGRELVRGSMMEKGSRKVKN
jgi:hypothetical protein